MKKSLFYLVFILFFTSCDIFNKKECKVKSKIVLEIYYSQTQPPTTQTYEFEGVLRMRSYQGTNSLEGVECSTFLSARKVLFSTTAPIKIVSYKEEDK